jgi:hypothetical protein
LIFVTSGRRLVVMSHGGVTLVMRAALTNFLIIVGAFLRSLVGSGRKRGEAMLVGTLGGISVGVLFAYLISPWLDIALSVGA